MHKKRSHQSHSGSEKTNQAMGSEPIDPNLPIPTLCRICRSQYGSESTNPNLSSIYQSHYGAKSIKHNLGQNQSTNHNQGKNLPIPIWVRICQSQAGAEFVNPNLGQSLPIPTWCRINLPVPIWGRIYQSQPDAESSNLWARNRKSQLGVSSPIPLSEFSLRLLS